MISTNASAVRGPTPGCVISRCTSGHFLASCSTAAVSSSIVGVSRSSNSSKSCRRRLAHGANGNFSNWARPSALHKQKTDRQDAQLLLKLLEENRFPRIWVASPENRDLRQLLWHRHRLVQMRTRIMNQLQALAMNEGQRRKKKLW